MAEPREILDQLGAAWSPDFDDYAAGRIDISAVRCVLCQTSPCECPPFGTPEYLELIQRRHGK